MYMIDDFSRQVTLVFFAVIVSSEEKKRKSDTSNALSITFFSLFFNAHLIQK